MMVVPNSPEESKCHQLFFVGPNTNILISKMVSVLWINSVLRGCDAILQCFLSDLIYEHKMELKKTSVYLVRELFPQMLSCRLQKDPGGSLVIRPFVKR